MGLMDDAMQSDSGFSADTDEFAEAVTYTRQDGGGTATVNAIVNRINARARMEAAPPPSTRSLIGSTLSRISASAIMLRVSLRCGSRTAAQPA